MTSVNEWIVREYFETLGYLVSQPRKYVVSGKQKKSDEEIDFVVHNPQVMERRVPDHIVWTTPDLRTVPSAVVGIHGWHTERFYASTFEQSPEILRFAQPASIRFAERLLGVSPVARILCLPKLPASGELKKKTISMLKDNGIDGVISFRTMLADLVAGVDTNKNYEKSDLLQILRLLKNYDLIRDDQMEFFGKRKTRARPVG